MRYIHFPILAPLLLTPNDLIAILLLFVKLIMSITFNVVGFAEMDGSSNVKRGPGRPVTKGRGEYRCLFLHSIPRELHLLVSIYAGRERVPICEWVSAAC